MSDEPTYFFLHLALNENGAIISKQITADEEPVFDNLCAGPNMAEVCFPFHLPPFHPSQIKQLPQIVEDMRAMEAMLQGRITDVSWV